MVLLINEILNKQIVQRTKATFRNQILDMTYDEREMTRRSTSSSLGTGDSNTNWVSDGEELVRKIEYQFSSHDTVALTAPLENLLSRSLRTVNFDFSGHIS